VKYTCLICGRSFPYLAAWYQHLIRCHPELEPDWARVYRFEGRRVSKWRVYLDLKSGGKVEVAVDEPG
jgi:hypothetical protein